MPSLVPPPPPLRRRNSDNTLIKEKLGWAPSIKLADGLKITHDWIKAELAAEGGDASAYATSTICGTAAPKELGTLRASDAEEKHN
jgi:GDP-D-mannose 3',5'-epimerase